MKNRYYDITAISITAAICVIVMYRQLVTPGMFSVQFNDTLYFLNWTRQFSGSLMEHVLYPRWLPESHGGYGNPTFVFYSPLNFYLAAFCDILIGDTIRTVNFLKFAGFFLSGVFMYLFVKDLHGYKAGLVASIVYLLLPYRIFDLYCMGIYASKLAYLWFPIILYFTKRAVLEERAGRHTAMLALSYCLLCLTHVLSAYMFAFVFIAYGFYTAGHGRFTRTAVRLILATFLGLSLAAFFLLPAFLERPFVHFDALLSKKYQQYWYNYLFHFTTPPAYHGLPYAGYLTETVIFSCLLGLSAYMLSRPFSRVKDATRAYFFLAVCAATFFMMSSASGFLWEIIPGMKLLQFSARWSSVLVFGFSALAGEAIWQGQNRGISFRRALFSLGGVIFILSVFMAARYDTEIISRSQFTSRLDAAGFLSEDVLEYLPRAVSLDWLENELKKPPAERVVPLSGGPVSIHIEKWDAVEREFEVSGSRDAPLRIRTFYYPGWRGFVDGKAVELSSEKDSDAILMNVPEGRHKVSLTFSDTPDRIWGKVLSGLAAALVLYIFVRSKEKSCYN